MARHIPEIEGSGCQITGIIGQNRTKTDMAAAPIDGGILGVYVILEGGKYEEKVST